METLASYTEDIDGGESPSISMLSEVAAARKITIIGGSIPEKASRKVTPAVFSWESLGEKLL
jgi:omega-amidase